MPKKVDILQCKHPNSRKVKTLLKQKKKVETKDKKKFGKLIKQNVIGEKLLWFQSNVSPNVTCCSALQTQELIEKYLGRFDDELVQINMKHSVGQRTNRQHANREDVIRMTIKYEEDEYKTCGLEIPNIMDPKQFETLKNWNGELRYLSNFVLKRFSREYLESCKNKSNNVKQKESIMDVE